MQTKTKSAKPKATKPAALRPVLVTTLHRGVFFGLAATTEGETIDLSGCRNVLYWPAECRGFLGLAANGPKAGAKLGPAASKVQLRNITSVAELSAESAKAFADFAVWG